LTRLLKSLLKDVKKASLHTTGKSFAPKKLNAGSKTAEKELDSYNSLNLQAVKALHSEGVEDERAGNKEGGTEEQDVDLDALDKASFQEEGNLRTGPVDWNAFGKDAVLEVQTEEDEAEVEAPVSAKTRLNLLKAFIAKVHIILPPFSSTYLLCLGEQAVFQSRVLALSHRPVS
jgi:hypothetical protein